MFSRRIALLTISLLTAAAWTSDRKTPADPDPNRFAQEIQTFADWDSKNAVPAEPVLFVGSSSIRLWRTRESFPDLPVLNRGFGGSHISDVLRFANRIILAYKPGIIVFYAGSNDIAAGKSAARVFEDYCELVHLVQASLPKTRMIFLAINPCQSRWSLWPEMKKANGLIRDFCQNDPRLVFTDFTGLFLGPDGVPDSHLFRGDQLHLNAAGYAAWTRALAPVLHRMQTPSRPGRDR